MTIIAFDVSKLELVGVRINKRAQIQEQYSLPNQAAVIEQFLDKSLRQHTRLLVASEATAEFHRPLALACLKRQIPFRLINPLVTKQFTRVTVRKSKTDLTDAWIIAKCVLQGEGTPVTTESFSAGKVLNRTGVNLGLICGMLLRMQRHLDDTGSGSEELRGKFTELKEIVEGQMRSCQEEAAQTLNPQTLKLLQTIPGIGPTLAVAFATELSPLERFGNAKAIVAYAGLDPKVKQSGSTLKRNTHLTKRGSPILRRAAYLAASIAQRADPQLKNYYEKKRNEGKRYREATIANARHILARVHAVWKRGTPYLRKSYLQEMN